jgi:hypothetical protein
MGVQHWPVGSSSACRHTCDLPQVGGCADDQQPLLFFAASRTVHGRMQMGHVYEALLIIQTIKANPRLTAAVKRCDQRTQASFDAVAVFLKSDDFKILRRIRNNAAFHYDGKLAIRHLEHIVEKFPNHPFAYSLGHETLDWYFQLGDEIIDRLVVRDIFKIPEGTDLRAELDAILLRLHKMATAFTDFAGYFIRHYAK